MQIVITTGEEGRATAQVLSGEPGLARALTESAAGVGTALDAGAAPALEDAPGQVSTVTPMAIEAGVLDGGAAPPELREVVPREEAVAPPEARPSQEAGAAPTIVDVFPTPPERPRPV